MKGLVPTHTALVGGVHMAGGGGGGELGAHVLERVCQEYHTARKRLLALGDGDGGEDEEEREAVEAGLARRLDNLVLILAYLYSFGVVACTLVYGLIRELVGPLGERDVELLLLLLRTAGPQLRADDPRALKDIVLAVQERAASVGAGEGDVNARVRHMLETLNDLKNNKRRQAQLQEGERTQRLRKLVLRARGGGGVGKGQGGGESGETLHVSWEDMRDSASRGRWWRVGAAWAGKEAGRGEGGQLGVAGLGQGFPMAAASPVSSSLQEKINSLASRQRMNTDVRRAIFASVMTACDYQDAFERLMRLNLSDKQEREVVRVIVDCLGQERAYNPYYAYLLGRLCEYHDKYKFTIQLTYWDAFKVLDQENAGFGADDAEGRSTPGGGKVERRAAGGHKAVNLARALSHLIAKGWLSLAVLKVVDVASVGAVAASFFRVFWADFLDERKQPDQEVLRAVRRVAVSKEPFSLTETLTACLHRFALGENWIGDTEERKRHKKRAKSLVRLLEKLSVSQFMGEGDVEGGRREGEGGWGTV
jgi:nucleolar MIF4G domain-containing protein 1